MSREALDPTESDFSTTVLMRNFESALEQMAAVGAVEVGADTAVIRLTQLRRAKRKGAYEMWNAHFTFLCFLVWPFIESYWLVLAGLLAVFRRGTTVVGASFITSRLQDFAKTLFHLGDLHFYEAASKERLGMALKMYETMGVINRLRVLDDRGSPIAMLQLGAKYQGKDGLAKLAELVDSVASYRRRGRDQKGMEDYPEYIARLAFAGAKL